MVEERQFRADLYYRLNVFPITVPPLRERRDDIPLLVRYFVQQYARRMNRRITHPAATMQALTRYHWPGNIRELQNFIERAVIVSPGPVLQAPVRELKEGAAAKLGMKRTTLQAKMRKLGVDAKKA
jgi:formate hydrogenlyase transcriptional activator